ncbi:MAG: CAP domain-containing protein [Anaerolineae bacterium]|nr:CAP domain-containing protein [Anaerolineae bacterium]
MRRWAAAAAPLLVTLALSLSAQAQTGESFELWRRFNEVRRANGAPMVAWSSALARAAQRHAEDMASNGFVDIIGSDGSTPRQRIEAAGYGRWQGRQLWTEYVYAGPGGFDEALAFLLSDGARRAGLLDARFREVGIGSAKGGAQTFWTVTLGAQPGVLPVFINDGALLTNNRQVAVQLSQEQAMPMGEGTVIGQVIEVRLSERPDFAGASWQPWEPLLPFTFSPGAGVKTLYVEMRDGAGRLATASATITYDPFGQPNVQPLPPNPAPIEVTPQPMPTQPPPSTPKPTATSAVQPVEPTRPIVLPPTPTPGVVIVVVQLTPTPTPVPTPDPLADFLATPAPRALAQSLNAQSGLPMNVIVPAYVIVQIGMLVVAFVAFIRRR